MVWHPKDEEGALICDTLFNHYHSETFNGLPENAIEVYGRSSTPDPKNNFSSTIPPIITTDGTIGHESRNLSENIAEYSVVLVFIGEHIVRSSLQADNEWYNYLNDILRIQQYTNKKHSRTLILPILPTHVTDYSNSPIISKLLDRQGVSQGDVGTKNSDNEKRSAASHGELMRDLGQAIVQILLSPKDQQEKLQIFVSHSRADIPESDLINIYPQGVVAKVRAWANKTKLNNFVHDLQPGAPWDDSIRQQVRNGALLMVRTDQYSRREWTQWEVIEAKRANAPIVCLDAATETRQQGSFIFDSVPRIVFPSTEKEVESENINELQAYAIIKALNLLVDISLKHKLWSHQVGQQNPSSPWKTLALPWSQRNITEESHFFTFTPQPPEPALLPSILCGLSSKSSENKHIWIMHPDPPIFPAEHDVIVECGSLAGFERQNIHIITPRTANLEIASNEGASFLERGRKSILNTLSDVTLGISASYSEDLSYFGLRPQHLELVVSKIAQVMMACGGSFTYAGGQVVSSTNVALRLLHETKQFLTQIRLQQHRLGGHPDNAIPCSSAEVIHLTPLSSCITDSKILDEVASLSKDIASYGKIHIVTNEEDIHSNYKRVTSENTDNESRVHNLSAQRASLSAYCNARLAISGKMTPASTTNPNGYQGLMPGIIEESLYALRAGQPLFIAGGFGGAAAILSDIVNKTDMYFGQQYVVESTYEKYKSVFEEIEDLYDPVSVGLNSNDIHRLATTRRPYEVARLVVKGLSSDGDTNRSLCV